MSTRAQSIVDRRASLMRAPPRIGLIEAREWHLVGYDLLAVIGHERDLEARARLTPRDPAWKDACPHGTTFASLEVTDGRTLVGEIVDGVAVTPARWVDDGARLDGDPAFERLRIALGLVDA